ncbi:hypothetical protein [Nodularia sphaerocarpa]|uniref:hypothetical protein n=1 Tax=Nodularia sphaerocarpa TaxID=137816 RepID=UPI001EFB185D|nr:hypothetical protein [Nodularia sphaerocarpa]MDB9373568.1 hypothetical protein [Nodularia sphaerocarpa CS-585]MDB9379473.1 hypothetical protein [Nodularia sphaerocarpa CS-585A2]ULP74356.1 hypothetical protein BDGGKGIB_04021 [Nodularia sphaerocarpa UHCC 0038]
MANIFQSWHELFLNLKANKYKISAAFKNSINNPKNDTLPPIILQNISQNNITLTYTGTIQSSNFWETFPKIQSLTQALDISTHLPIIHNPIITIQDFQTTKPCFNINISQVSPAEATKLLDSLPIENLVKNLFNQINTIEIQLSHDCINLKYLGEVELPEIINHLGFDLDLEKNNPGSGSFKVCNPTINIQGFGRRNLCYQVIIPQLNPEYIISLFSNLAGITLPDVLKFQLESLDHVGLVLSNSELYLNFAHDFQLKLTDFFILNSASPYIDVAFNSIITEIFGQPELRIAVPKLGFFKKNQGSELTLTGLLHSQEFWLTLGKRTTLHYKLPDDIDFSRLTNGIPVINDFKLINPELILTNIGYSSTHSKLGRINLSRGFNFIGDIDFTNAKTNFGSFIHSKLGIASLGVLISFNPGGLVSLTGNIQGNIQLFSVENFNATFTNLLIGLDIGVDLEPSFGLSGNLALQGYDPTQNDEPTLYLSGAVSLEPESLTAIFSQKGENPWCNPYGLVGTELRNISFQGGGTYLPPYFDNFGFVGDLKWEKIDIEVAFLMDTNDPEKLALLLTTNQAVSLVDLWQGPVSSFVLKQVNSPTDLVDKTLDFLNTFLDLNIQSIDRDGDGKLEPLIKCVPFPTKIAGQPIAEGLEINGKVTAWGYEATLILHSDRTFTKIEGSLNIPEIDLGFLKIGGTDDDCLDLALKVTPTEQYLSGDAHLEIFDHEIAKVEFQITPTNAIFKDFDLSLGNLLTIDVDNLSIDLKSGSGTGTGTILILGNTLIGSTFDITSNSITLKNTKLDLAGFLTVDVATLTINLANESATGTANITAFNQSLGSGTLSFNTQKVTINNAALNLANILKLNVPSLKVDLTNQKVFGLADVTLLGKQFTALGISINESGFQSSSNFDFGILAFNAATLTLSKGSDGNINNSASIAGNLKFLGNDFANINASVNSSKLTASGSFNFGGILMLKGGKNQKNATITLKKAKNGLYRSASISGIFYVLNQELTSIIAGENGATLKILGIKFTTNPGRVRKIRR